MEFNLENNMAALMEVYDDVPAPEVMDNSDERWAFTEQMAWEEKEREEAEAFSEKRFKDISEFKLAVEASFPGKINAD